jgi:hypothetical protein
MVKQEIIDLISKLPETVTIEDIMYELYLLQKHKNAISAIENGDVLTVEEVKTLMGK